MRQLWRFLHFLWTTATHALYTSVAVRRLPAPARPAFRARRQHIGSRRLCEVLGIELEIEGELDLSRPMLLVCNHFGVLDPLVLASGMPVAFVAKAGIAGWPFVGWVSRAMGVIFVERERRSQTVAFVNDVQARLHEGVSVLVFPEGTTTRERTVRPFKTGVFESVAGLEDGRVLPLYLDAVSVEGEPAVGEVRDRVVWAIGSPSFLRHFWGLVGLGRVRMTLRVGEPIPTAGRDRKELARLTYERVQALCRAVRAEVRPGV